MPPFRLTQCLGLVRVRAEPILERLQVLADIEHLSPNRPRRLARFRQGLLADRDQAVKFCPVRDQQDVELRDVVERFGVFDFDFGAEEEVDEALFEDACN